MLPTAASESLARVLTGPVRTVPVIASLPQALYLRTFDQDAPALCLAAADAVRVPCAAVLAPGAPVPAVAVGSTAEVGGGRVEVGGASVAVTRWWRPSRPLLRDADARERVLRGPAPEFELDVRALLGRGEGLTPLGDDVLAGALVTLRAAGHPRADELGSMVSEELAARPEATTAVSAALLVHAARGECVPQLAAVLTDPLDRLQPAVDALLRVGHSSGTGLLAGVRMGLKVVTGPEGSRSESFAAR